MVDFIITCHKVTLEPCLKKTTVRGFDKVEAISVGMPPSESWELGISTDNNEEKTV